MDNKFIEKIKFQESFAPFSKKQEIEFKGEIEIQNLIEFYLKSKGDKNAKENAKRFKINCVLGNNGGGKSKLIEGIFNQIKGGLSFNKVELTPYIYNSGVVLDDFFKLSGNIEQSVNFNLLNNGYKFFLQI